MKQAFIDCFDIQAARRQYREWRRIGYSKLSARRMVKAEYEMDPEISHLAMIWVKNNTNQHSTILFGRTERLSGFAR